MSTAVAARETAGRLDPQARVLHSDWAKALALFGAEPIGDATKDSELRNNDLQVAFFWLQRHYILAKSSSWLYCMKALYNGGLRGDCKNGRRASTHVDRALLYCTSLSTGQL